MFDGTLLVWLGLNDLDEDGVYAWADREAFDDEVNPYINLSTIESGRCILFNIDQLLSIQVLCDFISLSFVCEYEI